MKARRFLIGAAMATALVLVMAACSNEDASSGSSAAGTNPADPASITGKVRLFSYSDGFDPEYMSTFYETYPNIDLETASFNSNEVAVAKIQAGFQADVINSCVDEATLEMVNKGMYMPLDTSRLENWDAIWPGMKIPARGCRSTARRTSCQWMRAPQGSCTTPTRSPRPPRRGRTCSIHSTRGERRWRTWRSRRWMSVPSPTGSRTHWR